MSKTIYAGLAPTNYAVGIIAMSALLPIYSAHVDSGPAIWIGREPDDQTRISQHGLQSTDVVHTFVQTRLGESTDLRRALSGTIARLLSDEFELPNNAKEILAANRESYFI